MPSSLSLKAQMSRSLFPRKPIQPCLPKLAKEPPAGPNWIHEIKHDGFRILARRNVSPDCRNRQKPAGAVLLHRLRSHRGRQQCLSAFELYAPLI
jgi:hypothetical protein